MFGMECICLKRKKLAHKLLEGRKLEVFSLKSNATGRAGQSTLSIIPFLSRAFAT
jgi:hypothetical protein